MSMDNKLRVHGARPADEGAGPRLDATRYVHDPIAKTYRTFVPGFTGAVITTEDEHRTICQEYSGGATINSLCAAWGWPRPLMRGYLRVHERTHDMEPFTAEDVLTRDMGDLASDAVQLRRGQVSRRLKMDEWAETTKAADAWRRFEVATLDPMLAALREGRAAAPAPRPTLSLRPMPFDLVLPIFDAHEGKDCVDTNNAIVDEMHAATEDLMTRVIRRIGRPSRIIAANGGDLGHVDGPDNRTRRGTPQDVHQTHRVTTERAAYFQASHIEALRVYAPVTFAQVEGNHDPTTGHAIYLYTRAHFRGDKRVTVLDYAPRQYVVSGRTLLGFKHNNRTPAGMTLGQVAAQERPQDWAATDRVVFVVGDYHHLEVKEQGRVEVWQVRSPNGTDKWHHDSMYVGARRAIAGLVIAHDTPGVDMTLHVGVGEVGR